jgi:O-antigen/teichoic acid export membrane protein
MNFNDIGLFAGRWWVEASSISRRIVPAFTGNVFRLGASFLLSKYVAVVHGPAGVALLGQFLNFSGIVTSLSTGSIDNGVVRYVAESRRDGPDRLAQVLSASAQIIGGLSCITAIVLFCAAGPLAERVFYSRDYAWILALLALFALGQGVLTWCSGTLNGLGRLASLGMVNIIGAWATVALVCLAAYAGPIEHRTLLAGLALVNLPAAAYALWQLFRARAELPAWRLRRWPLAPYFQFARYSLMSGGAALMVPFTAMTVRALLVRHTGLEGAGVYEGVSRLSSAYLALITTTLAMYYLPRISGASNAEQRTEMHTMLRVVGLGVGLVGVLVWLLRDQLLTSIYSREFVVSGRLMFLQVIGDMIKMCSWVLAYQMIARGMVGTFLCTEAFAAGLRIGVAAFLVPALGPEGAVASHTVTSIAYLAAMFWIFRDQFRPQP